MGRALVWYSTCVNSLALSHLQNTCKRAGSAAEQAEIIKSHNGTSNYLFAPSESKALALGSQYPSFYKILSRKLIDGLGNIRALSNVLALLYKGGTLPTSRAPCRRDPILCVEAFIVFLYYAFVPNSK